ncbi:MAG: serine/threonine protein kinase, partial [bacterium]|nr:serine/threonine protein kinase [bacterium]
PNIVTIYDVGQVEECYYMVMEYFQESLKDQIDTRGKIEPGEALHIVKQLADALFCIAGSGIVHRDVKAANIMIRNDGTPVLLDFGVAKDADSSTPLTITGTILGTPYYMSPEQCMGEKLDGRSDIYALGVLLYEMLTGKVPYSDDNLVGILLKHAKEPIPRLQPQLNDFQHLIDRMMAKDKNKRLQSAEELNSILKELFARVKAKSTNHAHSHAPETLCSMPIVSLPPEPAEEHVGEPEPETLLEELPAALEVRESKKRNLVSAMKRFFKRGNAPTPA